MTALLQAPMLTEFGTELTPQLPKLEPNLEYKGVAKLMIGYCSSITQSYAMLDCFCIIRDLCRLFRLVKVNTVENCGDVHLDSHPNSTSFFVSMKQPG